MGAVEQNTIIAKDSIDELRSALIAEILTAASAAIATQERFVLTLSGGSMVDVLCCPEFHSVDGMDYRKWVILLADERALPRGHPENTYSAYKQRLPDEFLEQVSFPDPFHSQLSIEAAAEDYAAWIGRHQITLDLVLLGVGPDGHTASLFPPVCPAMLSDARTIIPVPNSPKPPAERISMSLSFLKSAKLVIHVASGPSKHQAVERITRYNDLSLPPSHIPGIWLIDKAAFTGC